MMRRRRLSCSRLCSSAVFCACPRPSASSSSTLMPAHTVIVIYTSSFSVVVSSDIVTPASVLRTRYVEQYLDGILPRQPRYHQELLKRHSYTHSMTVTKADSWGEEMMCVISVPISLDDLLFGTAHRTRLLHVVLSAADSTNHQSHKDSFTLKTVPLRQGYTLSPAWWHIQREISNQRCQLKRNQARPLQDANVAFRMMWVRAVRHLLRPGGSRAPAAPALRG